MSETILQDGVYILSGVEAFHNNNDWDDREGYYIVLNNEVYAIEYNHDDGWRSYGSIYKEPNARVSFRFPGQKVIVRNTKRRNYESGEDYIGISIFDAKNGKLVFEVGTNFADAYYPIATMVYIPENLSINQGK